MTKIIALYSPQPQMGKSTVASLLEERLTAAGLTVKRLPFAGPLKRIAAGFFRELGISEDDIAKLETTEKHRKVYGDVDARRVYQTIGYEWGRRCISPGLWVDLWRQSTIAAAPKHDVLITDDMRFPNEHRAVTRLNGLRIQVVADKRVRRVACEHESEGALDEHDFDHILTNNGTIDELTAKVDWIAHKFNL